jgi:membrane-associated protein
MSAALQTILHLDQHLSGWVVQYGSGIYALLFLILFCETGLIVTPFLPGDSLLFALGALTSMSDGGLSFPLLAGLLVVAAFIGDNLNYSIGRALGDRILQAPEKPWLKKKNIERTQEFMDRYGNWAIILARFIPLVRTFATFVAGLGKMDRRHFMLYSLVGAGLWTQIFLWLGNIFGQTPFVKKNFSLLVVAVIVISVVPILVAAVKVRLASVKARSGT